MVNALNHGGWGGGVSNDLFLYRVGVITQPGCWRTLNPHTTGSVQASRDVEALHCKTLECR